MSILAIATLAQSSSSAVAQRSLPALTDLNIERSALLVKYVNGPGPSSPAPSGAFSLNARYERGELKKWNVALQRQAENTILNGLVLGRRKVINRGIKMIDWALARQRADGSFKDSSSSSYQYGFFVSAAARSILLLQQSLFAADYATAISRIREGIGRAAVHMLHPAFKTRGDAIARPFVHRRYVIALALELAGQLTSNRDLQAAGDSYIRAALSRQRKDGVNPEAGGADSTYQAIGMTYAERWLVYRREGRLRNRVRSMIARGLRWELGRITKAGNVRRVGDTRTKGQEVRIVDGKIKTISYTSIVRSLAYWGARTSSNRHLAAATRVARRHLTPRSASQ